MNARFLELINQLEDELNQGDTSDAWLGAACKAKLMWVEGYIDAVIYNDMTQHINRCFPNQTAALQILREVDIQKKINGE